LNISLAGLGMWNGTMGRDNKKKQNSKSGQEIESTVSTNKKSCQIKDIVVCIDVTYRWHYSLMSSKMEVYE
jgi:hypothetical protein